MQPTTRSTAECIALVSGILPVPFGRNPPNPWGPRRHPIWYPIQDDFGRSSYGCLAAVCPNSVSLTGVFMQTRQSGSTIRPMVAADLSSAWELRLRALRDHPDAFGQPYENAASLTPVQVQETWTTRWDHGDNRVFVAVDPNDRLLGMAGIAREHTPKMRHRGDV